MNQSAVEAIVGDRIDDIVLVQNTQPTEEDNKIWIPNGEIAETQVPTYEDFSQLKNSLDTATDSDIGKALSPKTVTGGHVTEWQFKSIGGAGGTSDYSELENKPQINGVTLTGNKSLADLGVASASDVAGKYTKPVSGIPASDLSSAVQASLGKADTALQGQDVTSAVDNYLEANFSNPSNPPLDRTLTSSLSAAPADMVGEIKSAINDLEDVLVDEVSSTITLSPMATETQKLLLIANSGNITAGSFDNQKVYAYNIEGYDGLHFNFYGRLDTEANYSFYSASELSGCDSTTVIGSVTAYVSAGADNYIDTIPSGAKTVVIGARQDGVMRGINNSIVSKADSALAATYDTEIVYYVGDYCTHEGNFYRRVVYSGTYGAWNASEWEQTKPGNELKTINTNLSDVQYFDSELFQIGSVNSNGEVITSIKYGIVDTNIIHIPETITLQLADGFTVQIYYYNSDGTYKNNNGGIETFDGLTILPDSYVRLTIRIDGSTATLTQNDIPKLVHAVSFATEYAKRNETIADNADGAMKALSAKMFQKGGSPVSFSRYPCILIAGQSNIDGRVPKANLPASIVPPFDNIKNSINSVNGTFASSMILPNSFGIDFSLYSALNDLGTPWYIIKRSMGGTSISPLGDSAYHWTPFYEELDNISNSLLYSFRTQIAKCEEDNPNTFDFRALIWQQGEGDRASKSKHAALDYYKNFKCLIAYIRGITGNETLPVICGTVSHLSGQYDPIVEEATLKVAEEDPYMTCIDMSGATLLDSYHFDAECAIYFGYKAYDALIDFGVVSGTKINPTPPWEN